VLLPVTMTLKSKKTPRLDGYAVHRVTDEDWRTFIS